MGRAGFRLRRYGRTAFAASAIDSRAADPGPAGAGATVDILRISGGTLLYSALGLSSESHGIQSGEFTAVLSHQGFAETPAEMPTYRVNLYHGLRRYEDPGMTIPNGNWETPVVRKRNGIPAIQSAARLGLICNPVLSVFRPFKRALRDRAQTPAPVRDTFPDTQLDNIPKLWSRIPQRYGRSVFGPDIAHPPCHTGSGSTVTTARLFCLGVGAYEIHRVWVSTILAWENGSATGDVAGFSITNLGPGAAILPSISTLGKSAFTAGRTKSSERPSRDYDRYRCDIGHGTQGWRNRFSKCFLPEHVGIYIG